MGDRLRPSGSICLGAGLQADELALGGPGEVDPLGNLGVANFDVRAGVGVDQKHLNDPWDRIFRIR